MNRLVILSGPSCVGKTPLHHALKKHFPEIAESLVKLVPYTSRPPRPKEVEGVDYFFRSGQFVENLKKKTGFRVFDVRGDLHAFDVKELRKLLKTSSVLFEGNPFVAEALLTELASKNAATVSVFISPISREEILFFKSLPAKLSLPDLIADIIRRKLLRRTQRQKGILSQADLEDIERRAKSAYNEIRQAHRFDFVIPNHDGEDSENWDAFYYPIGEARKTLLSLVKILKKERPEFAEKWEENLL